MNDIRRMRLRIVNHVRFAGFSVTALAMIAFLKLTPAAYAWNPPEPRMGEAPKTAPTTETNRASEDQRIRALEADVARLGAEIANLRSALKILGLQPDHVAMDLPVDGSAGPEAVSAAPSALQADPLGSITKSSLFAPAPPLKGASSLFYEAELGSFKSRQAAEADWRRLSGNARLAALAPRFSTIGTETRLSVGSLPSQAAADALCVELSAMAGACRPVVPVRAY